MKKDRECKHCGKIFKNIEGRVFSNHVRWCNDNPKNPRNEKYRKTLSEKAYKREEKKNGKIKSFEVCCNNCGKKFQVKERERKFPSKEKYFCCTGCAHTRDHSDETRQKIRNSIKDKWKDPEYRNKMMKNGYFLKGKRFTSKGEEEIRRYFIEKYPEDEWTSGGLLNHNGVNISRDLYSKKLKVCFEYDGIWHFKDIHDQLEDKQKKDNELENWCKENGYRLIRIDEDIYKKNKRKYLQVIKDEIYNGVDDIVKIGDKY